MRRVRVLIGAALVALAVALGQPVAAEQSPVFGQAELSPMDRSEAAQVTARGYWADYYGSLGMDNAYSAYLYSYYAYSYAWSNSYNEYNWYLTASNYAYSAYLYNYYAYYYSYYGW